jgi:hypothetical protein
MGAPLYMKLRDQLRTDKETFYNWPPTWTNRQDRTDKLRGEIGNLQEVMMTEAADDILFIAIEYQGRRYMGAMFLDSPALCRQIYLLLQSHIGLSIEEIGDLDLP